MCSGTTTWSEIHTESKPRSSAVWASAPMAAGSAAAPLVGSVQPIGSESGIPLAYDGGLAGERRRAASRETDAFSQVARCANSLRYDPAGYGGTLSTNVFRHRNRTAQAPAARPTGRGLESRVAR